MFNQARSRVKDTDLFSRPSEGSGGPKGMVINHARWFRLIRSHHASPTFSGFSPEKQCMFVRIARAWRHPKTVCIEIGGVHARRRSNRADVRSKLTFRPLLQQFSHLLLGALFDRPCAKGQADRHSICTVPGALRSSHHPTPWNMAPGATSQKLRPSFSHT